MNAKFSIASHVKSLFWVALFLAIILGFSMLTELLFIDFIHGNPHRTKENALQMAFLDPLIFGIVALIGVFLVFTLPQLFQAILGVILMSSFEQKTYLGILLALPITAFITWNCYDYLTPTDFNLGINAAPDWTPYQHGITIARYFGAFGAQTAVTIFSLLYCNIWPTNCSRKHIICTVLILAIVIGIAVGCRMAKGQLQFV